MKLMMEIQKLFGPSMTDPNVAITRGYNMSFGVLSKEMINAFDNKVFEVLIANCLPKDQPDKPKVVAKPIIGLDKGKMDMDTNDAETRKQTVKSLIQVVKTVGLTEIKSETRKQILETFYKCFDDYAVDRRGDVGSWVRQESMYALYEYFVCILDTNDDALIADIGANTKEFYERFISTYLQQLNEKIDRIREHAGRGLQKFFKFLVPRIGNIDFSRKDELTCMFL